jgi:tRNA-splicing ligase RtcB
MGPRDFEVLEHPADIGSRAFGGTLPKAYKNVDELIEVVHNAGLARKVARLRPMGVIKG